MENNFELKFDPKTIEHLGVKMYSTLPPALAELISNAYDADARKVTITFHEQNGTPISIFISDDGYGMSSDDIQNKFLVIGRNRRHADGDIPSPRFMRLPTGKKGLGKLALFGLAKEITVDTIKNNVRNRFLLDWDSLLSANGSYKPTSDLRDKEYKKNNGTVIKLAHLKRKTPFDMDAIADSLSRIFIVDNDFEIILKHSNGTEIIVSNERKYNKIKSEFEWAHTDIDIEDTNDYLSKIEARFITSEMPIPPSSGLRGVTLFSRGKLINAPEYFSSSTSSHFFQYLTGWIRADFIDTLDEDVISTNRQSINWDNPEMENFRDFLSSLISKISASWRDKRKDRKEKAFTETTGINKEKWMSTLPESIKTSAQKIVDTLSNEEGVSLTFSLIIMALHEIIPEYPLLHWRHLHSELRPRIESYYKNKQYGEAADQSTKIYAQVIREISGVNKDGTDIASLFSAGKKDNPGATPPTIKIADISTESGWNIQDGQGHLTRGLMAGFRNPINHSPIDELVPSTFTELDCLNILSLVSYLLTRLDNAEVTEMP